jgi:hypothetical protein
MRPVGWQVDFKNPTKSTMRIACTLTYAGILPFLLLSLAVILKISGYDYDLALRAYGAVIISFLCGIDWAIHLLFPDQCPRNFLVYSNAVTLVAFGSIFFGFHGAGLIIESLCLAFLLKLDYELVEQHITPVWYFNLRRNATLAVVVLLTSAACLS